MQSLLPLEEALEPQTYLVQDTLSLADIIVAFDLKQPLEQVIMASLHVIVAFDLK